ncbi:MAG: UDP-N-acetylglucosamine 2-epimerase (non-hydrolyzing), partial [Methanobacteriaceae archaeon]|nr:UDP-N-acetylglucosamine 2-epimerase (non-hydrolyzing) [Methanobacteriaceae archaeon]
EEINRMVADVCSHLYYVPTEESALNLVAEGINPKKVIITGNTVVDACLRNLAIAKNKSDILSQIDGHENILTLTMHRAENVDNLERLTQITDALLELEELTIVFPVHPRTLKNLEKFGIYSKLVEKDHIKIIKPVGYLDFLLLLSSSSMIMTDSGGLQEEAITLNVPCMTLRYNTERPETVTAGGNILVGSKKDKIIETAHMIMNDPKIQKKMKKAKNPYGDGKASKKILDVTVREYENGNLNIQAPDDLMNQFKRKMELIDYDITVKEFENSQNAIIRTVYDNGKAVFPHEMLKLKNKYILFDHYSKGEI